MNVDFRIGKIREKLLVSVIISCHFFMFCFCNAWQMTFLSGGTCMFDFIILYLFTKKQWTLCTLMSTQFSELWIMTNLDFKTKLIVPWRGICHSPLKSHQSCSRGTFVAFNENELQISCLSNNTHSKLILIKNFYIFHSYILGFVLLFLKQSVTD